MSALNETATSFHDLLPYVTSLLTALVAIIAVIVNRLSARDAIMGQWRQEIWKRRSERRMSYDILQIC